MTVKEQKIRLDFAIEMLNKVYSDLCHMSGRNREEVSKEQIDDFCDLMTGLYKFSDGLVKEQEGD